MRRPPGRRDIKLVPYLAVRIVFDTMDPEAMILHGLSLRDHFHGAETVQLTIRRDDGVEYSLPVSYFFRPADEFSPIGTTSPTDNKTRDAWTPAMVPTVEEQLGQLWKR